MSNPRECPRLEHRSVQSHLPWIKLSWMRWEGDRASRLQPLLNPSLGQERILRHCQENQKMHCDEKILSRKSKNFSKERHVNLEEIHRRGPGPVHVRRCLVHRLRKNGQKWLDMILNGPQLAFTSQLQRHHQHILRLAGSHKIKLFLTGIAIDG